MSRLLKTYKILEARDKTRAIASETDENELEQDEDDEKSKENAMEMKKLHKKYVRNESDLETHVKPDDVDDEGNEEDEKKPTVEMKKKSRGKLVRNENDLMLPDDEKKDDEQDEDEDEKKNENVDVHEQTTSGDVAVADRPLAAKTLVPLTVAFQDEREKVDWILNFLRGEFAKLDNEYRDYLMKAIDELRGMMDNNPDNTKSVATLKPASESFIHDTLRQMFVAEQMEFPENFFRKAATLFEIASTEAAIKKTDEIKQQYAKITATVLENIWLGVDSVLESLREEWLEKYKPALLNERRVEVATSFLEGLRDLYKTHAHVLLTEEDDEEEDNDKDTLYELIDRLADELESVMNELEKLRSEKENLEKKQIVDEAVRDLSLVDAERVRKLCSFDEAHTSLDVFRHKVKLIVEHVKAFAPVKSMTINTSGGETATTTDNIADPRIRTYVETLSRFAKQ